MQCLKYFVVSFMKTLERWFLSLITGRVFCLSQIHHTAHPPGPSLAPDQNIFKYSQPSLLVPLSVCYKVLYYYDVMIYEGTRDMGWAKHGLVQHPPYTSLAA